MSRVFSFCFILNNEICKANLIEKSTHSVHNNNAYTPVTCRL